jgi:hypothetical protein
MRRLLVSILCLTAVTVQTPSFAQAERAALVEKTRRLAVEILPEVVALDRFRTWQPVKIEAKTKAELRVEVIPSLRELHGVDGLARAGRVMTTLGLLPAGYDLESGFSNLLIELMGGGYDPQRQVFYVLMDAPGAMRNLRAEELVAAHELTHALQDQASDMFAQQRRGVTDWDFDHVYNCVCEGMAYVTMMAVVQEVALDQAPDAAALLQATRAQLEASPDYPVLAAAPPYVKELIFGRAIRGTAFIRALLRDRPTVRLATLLDSLPASTEQILHYEKFTEGDRPASIDLSALDRHLPRDWRPYFANSLSELEILLLAEGHDATRPSAASIAAGWDGCRFRAFEATDGSLAILGLAVWDTAEDAREFSEGFVRALADCSGPGTVAVEQSDLLVRFVVGLPEGPDRRTALEALAAARISS